jgi:thioredoxin 1
MLRNLFGRNKRAPVQAATPAPAAGDARPQPIDVTDATFDQAVLASSQLAVVDFWAEWCAPCTTMSAYVSFLAADYDGRLTVAALDVDENPASAERYQVMGLPTLLFLFDGAEVDRIVGLTPYEELKHRVNQLLANYPSGQTSGHAAEVHDASL